MWAKKVAPSTAFFAAGNFVFGSDLVIDSITGAIFTLPFPGGGLAFAEEYVSEVSPGINIIFEVAYTMSIGNGAVRLIINTVLTELLPIPATPSPLIFSAITINPGDEIEIIAF